MPAKPPAAITAKIRKLVQLTRALERGEDFMITRLTTIKSLCTDELAATQFARYLAVHALQAMNAPDGKTAYLAHDQRQLYHHAALDVLGGIDAVIAERTPETIRDLSHSVYALEQLQNRYEHIYGGAVRIVENMDALAIEYAGRSVVAHDQTGYWAYKAARSFAERYDSRYGTGLIPASAPMVHAITDFWCRYYFGQSLDERWPR
jgi:hypothetical protein